MRFVTLFLPTQNVHLLKDVGMIPYMLCERYQYDACIACYRNENEYNYLNTYVKGLKLEFVKKIFPGRILNGLIYLRKMSNKIDILNVYHLNLSSFVWICFFKLLNIKGKVYLKLDMDMIGYAALLRKDAKGWIKRKTIDKADFISVESKWMQNSLKNMFNKEIAYIPNGCSFIRTQDKQKKENIILTVARLGTLQKATDILLEAFARSAQGHNWTLRLVGPIEKEFQAYIDNFYRHYPNLSNRVIFTGEISDKKELQNEYMAAKVFVLPSRWESFGIALVEALCSGCFIITTNGVVAADDMLNSGKCGKKVAIDDIDGLAKVFGEITQAEWDWYEKQKEIKNFAEAHFSWEKIIGKLYHYMGGESK